MMESAAKPISAEIITTGTELLLGEIVDTNAVWIAQRLRDAGVNLFYKTSVGDNEARVRGVLEIGLSRSDVLIVTGGLGPTVDDITRQAIADAAGRELVIDAGALETLKERFARFGVRMTDNNLQQAMVPDGAELIPNPVGTAPGFIVDTGNGVIIAIPGVPREMKRLMTDTVLPYLSKLSGQPSVIRRRILRTIGIGESTLDSVLGELMHASNPTIGLAAKTAQADVRITARAESVDEAERMIDEMASLVYEQIGDHVYSTVPDEPIESVIVKLLSDNAASLALFETNTEGKLAERIREIDGSEQVLVGSMDARESELSQPIVDALRKAGADTSGEEVAALASVVKESSGSSYALAIVGTYETGGGIYGDGAGQTWIALVDDEIIHMTNLGYGSTEDFTVTRIGNQALATLWQALR